MKKLRGVYRFMTNLIGKLVGKGLAEKTDRTPEEDDMLDMMLHGGDSVSKDNLAGYLSVWYAEMKSISQKRKGVIFYEAVIIKSNKTAFLI